MKFFHEIRFLELEFQEKQKGLQNLVLLSSHDV